MRLYQFDTTEARARPYTLMSEPRYTFTFARGLLLVAVLMLTLFAFGVTVPLFHLGWGGLAVALASWLVP